MLDRLLQITLQRGSHWRECLARNSTKEGTIADFLEPLVIKIQSKIGSTNNQKNDHPKTWLLMPKGCQNGAEFDATSHQKSMPKLVTKKIMKLIKRHVSLNGKIIKFQCKNNCFWWFIRLQVPTAKVSTKTSKVRLTNFILEKGHPKDGKSSTTMIKQRDEKWVFSV